MDEKRLQEQITQAVQHRCAHLQPDPFLARKVLRAAERKEPVTMHRKLHLGVILTLVLMLLTVTAVAAVILGGMELIEQEAVPLAQGNDGAVRLVDEFSYEELRALITAAAENGIILDDSTHTMRALRSGEGYYEEETIMDICREIFGGMYYEWTVEQRHWFGEIMIAIGFWETNNEELPGPDDLPSEEVRALARQTVWDKYGADVPLTDPDKYRCEEWFYGPENDAEPYAYWTFQFKPKTLEGATYYVSIDSKGEWIEHYAAAQDWSAYNEQNLIYGLDMTYGYVTRDQTSWPPEAWVVFGQMLPQAEHSDRWGTEHEAYLASVYLLPDAGDLSAARAKSIALTDAAVTDYVYDCAVLLGNGDQCIWKVSFAVVRDGVRRETWVYEIDSRSGEILYKAERPLNAPAWGNYVLQETYARFDGEQDDRLTLEEAVLLAQAAFYEELGEDDIPYTDENYFTIDARHLDFGTQGYYWLIFETKTMAYGRASADVMDDGTVKINYVGKSGVDGDNLHDRFEDVYGSCNRWDQSVWVQFGQEMAKYEPTTFVGKLFKQTAYPDASTVALSLDDALDVVYRDCGAEQISAVLIDAEPNPVWKIRSDPMPYTFLYEIDAMTGEIVDKEYYVIQRQNFDHWMKQYTLRRDFMPAELAEFGIERVAMELCVKTDMAYFDGVADVDVFTETSCYSAEVDGMTVTFRSLNGRYPTYRVTVAEDVMSAQVVKLTEGAEEGRDEAWIAEMKEQYGEDVTYWPLDKQVAYHGSDSAASMPEADEMSQAEAVEYARQALIDAQGQEALDALGDYVVGNVFLRYDTENGEMTCWWIYFAEAPEYEADGWCVYFDFIDDKPNTMPVVKPIAEFGNG